MLGHLRPVQFDRLRTRSNNFFIQMIKRTLVFSDIYPATLPIRVKYFIVTLRIHMCMWPERAAYPYRHSTTDWPTILQFYHCNNCELVGSHTVQSEWPVCTATFHFPSNIVWQPDNGQLRPKHVAVLLNKHTCFGRTVYRSVTDSQLSYYSSHSCFPVSYSCQWTVTP